SPSPNHRNRGNPPRSRALRSRRSLRSPRSSLEIRCKACLFDLDGVLVDSRGVVERTWRRWGQRHQLDVAPMLRIAHGRRARDTLRATVPHLATDAEVAWLDAAELEDVEGLRPIRGAREFLASLPPERWGIVTSCSRPLAQ